MKILFVHQNFPGQYLHIIKELSKDPAHQLVALGINSNPELIPPGVTYYRYEISRGNTKNIHPMIHDTESKVIRGEACAKYAHQLKLQGFYPDLICAHPGWGESIFLKDIWPNAPLLSYQEFYYNPRGFDCNFDPELQTEPTWDDCATIRMRNSHAHHSLLTSSWNITPTKFQLSSYPLLWQPSFSTIHDGINTHIAKPNLEASSLKLKNGISLEQGKQIVTYINRAFEPYRGCHTLLRSIPHLQEQQPDAQVIIIGDQSSANGYGKQPERGTWAEHYLKEIEGNYDPSKVHFVGLISRKSYLKILQLSSVHIYLTYPFVLSWSLLEAMSTGCAVIGSSTEPVKEIISHGKNGWLVDFFQPKMLANATSMLLKDRMLAKELGQNARKTIINSYSLEKCLPRHLELMDTIANGTIPL